MSFLNQFRMENILKGNTVRLELDETFAIDINIKKKSISLIELLDESTKFAE